MGASEENSEDRFIVNEVDWVPQRVIPKIVCRAKARYRVFMSEMLGLIEYATLWTPPFYMLMEKINFML